MRTLKKDREVSLAHVILKWPLDECYHAGINFARLTKKSARRAPFYVVTQAAVKRKQKSLSREQRDRFDEAHAPKFKSTSGPVKSSSVVTDRTKSGI